MKVVEDTSRAPARRDSNIVSKLLAQLLAQRAAIEMIAASFGVQFCFVITGILTARSFGPDLRGNFTMFFLITLIVSQLIGLGVPSGITYFLSSGKIGVPDLIRELRIVVIVQMTIMVLVQAAITIWYVGDSGHSIVTAGLLSVPIGCLTFLLNCFLAIIQGQQRFRALMLLRFLWPAIYAVAIIAFFVLDINRPIEAVIGWGSAILISTIVVGYFAIMIPSARTNLPRTTDRREILSFSSKALLGTVSPTDSFQLDQALVGVLLSSASLGTYTTATSFTNLPRLFANAIGTVAYPKVASARTLEASRSIAWKYTYLGAAFCGLASLFIAAVAGTVIPLLFGSAYDGAVGPARILMLATFLTCIRRVLADASRGLGLPGASSRAELFSWLWMVPSVVLFSKWWGLNGVAIAIVGSAIASLVVLLVLVRTASSSTKSVTPVTAAQ